MNNTPTSAPFLRWIKKHKPLSYGILFCLALLCLTFITLLSLSITKAEKLKLNESRYGQHITDMAANKLTLATASNDLISMQAELNELTQIETIYTAIIYDINNIPKVQSGMAFDRLYLENNHSSYSASITQDENILGQLTIVMAQNQTSNSFATLIALIFLASLTALVFFFYKIYAHFSKTESEGESTIEHSIAELKPIEPSNIYLLIQFKNIDTVFKQLSKEIREQRYQAILSSISKTLKIYNGEIIGSGAESLLILISNNEKTQAVINASCCAGLINLIATKEQWFIKMSHIIYQNDEKIGSIENLIELQHIKQLPNNGIFIQKILDENINNISTTEALNKKSLLFLALRQFNQQYQQLLDNQCQHLTSSSNQSQDE